MSAWVLLLQHSHIDVQGCGAEMMRTPGLSGYRYERTRELHLLCGKTNDRLV